MYSCLRAKNWYSFALSMGLLWLFQKKVPILSSETSAIPQALSRNSLSDYQWKSPNQPTMGLVLYELIEPRIPVDEI